MPLDDRHRNSAAPRTARDLPATSVLDLSDHPPLSQLSGVLDLPRAARAARQLTEGLVDPLHSSRPDSPRYRLPVAPSAPSGTSSVDRSTSNASSSVAGLSTTYLAVGAGRRQDHLRYRVANSSALPQYHSYPERAHSTSQLARQRHEDLGLPHSGLLTPNPNLLRGELGANFSSRLSMLRANALLMRDDLEHAMDELALPLHRSRYDSISPRNHHRHSSMSTSPRVLETPHPTAISSRRRTGNVDDRLEDVLFFLDTQRVLHPSAPSPASFSCHFNKSLVSKCSWLRPASQFHGVQTFKGTLAATTSHLSRQLLAPQAFQSKEWKVEVVVDWIDYSNMSIAGSMSTWTMPQSEQQQRVKTFWTGEVSPCPFGVLFFLSIFLFSFTFHFSVSLFLFLLFPYNNSS
jgi:hypothetical protein